MPSAFVVDWHAIDLQNDVSMVESKEWPVCGAEAQHVDRAVQAIQETEPDVVVAWANRKVGRTQDLLGRLHREGDTPPVLFVDAVGEDRHILDRMAEPAVFTDIHHLEDGLNQAKRVAKKAKKAAQGADEGSG